MSRPLTPALAVDLVIELVDQPDRPIVLIERLNPPPGFALPGGFVDLGERVEDAARREALEETGLEVELKSLLGVYSDPARDARGHTVSIVYLAEASGQPRAGDDAARILVTAHNTLPQLAFDHAKILADYARSRRTR